MTKSNSRWNFLTGSNVVVTILLLFTMLLGGYFRFTGNNWDDFVHFHPDERYLTGVGIALDTQLDTCGGADYGCIQRMERVQECRERHPETGGIGGYFDSDCSVYNPENVYPAQYSYGTLPLFIARKTAEFLNWGSRESTWDDYNVIQKVMIAAPYSIAHGSSNLLAEGSENPNWLGYGGFPLVWRALNALVDTFIILLIFFIGVRLHNKWTGLVAAMLYAGAVLPIQLSHFGTTDVITNLFVTWAIFFALRTQDTGKLRDYAAFGIMLGAAVASRINVAPLAAVIAIVALVRTLPAFESKLAWQERSRIWNRNVGGVFLAAVLSLIVFRICNPYAFSGPYIFGILPYDRFLDTLANSRNMVSGDVDWAPNWQWANRTPYLFSFQNIVLWGLGIALGVTAWIVWAWSGWRLLRGKADALRQLVPFIWVAGYFAFTGGLWVMSMRYYLPLYPSLVLLAAWGLVEFARRAFMPSRAIWRRGLATCLLVGVVGFTLLWGAMFTNIYRHMATFNQASHWVWENLPGDFYMRIDDAEEGTPLVNIPLWNTRTSSGTPVEDAYFLQASRLSPGSPMSVRFIAPATGTISAVHAPHLGDPFDLDENRTLQISISQADGTTLASAELTSTFARTDHFIGESYVLPLNAPLQVTIGETYFFQVEVEGNSPIISAGTLMLNEPWDEGMPAKVCNIPIIGVTLADDPPSGLLSERECDGRSADEGLINIQTLDLHWEDEPNKRDRMQVMLDQADTIIIGTNRRYDSQSRNPSRWPMTNLYYETLFSGELGFDLIATFQETFELGPLRISDQHLPTYSSPGWLNEFEPEEAFHVYDHPVVFIFRKNKNYSSRNTQGILQSVELNRVGLVGGYNDPTIVNVIPDSSRNIDRSPTQLQFTDEMSAVQSEGGTWSKRFDTDSPVNRNPFLALVTWWVMIMLFGLVTWPLLFVMLPALADRGYGFAKIAGMMLVAWTVWTLSTLRIPAWSRMGILSALLGLAGLSTVIAWRNREKMLLYLRSRWKLLVWIEVITFALFMVMIGVRLTNPDLWHQSFGGEKPMDFAYFNGILRSTIFPAIDPWFAGGYLNYYYFGYVIVGVPTLLLGVVPSVAYNLILPTLFAITGIGAFSVAFSIVNGWRVSDPLEEMPSVENHRRSPLGNPWVAGGMALMMAVVFGNLDTVRVFGAGVARLGGYQQSIEENISYPEGLVEGFGRLLSGDNLYISPERWFWGPTRVIAEIPNQNDGAINEMPFFTFVYADMHAHMISMPMMLFAMAFLYNELMVAGRDRRTKLARLSALCLGAITVGLFFPTNSWDYPTFLILSVAGLGYAWWLTWKTVTRWSVLNGIARIGGFAILTQLAMLPFTWWFASGLASFKIWDGKKTPLWAYLDIHGLFVFFIVSLLLWETARWLRSIRVSALRGRFNLLAGLLAGFLLTMFVTLLLVLLGYDVALIVLPLIVWIAVLFFRPGQARPMQYILVLSGLGLAITLGTELLALANDNGRQNTIFKFYIQVWLLFSISGGVAFAWITSNSLAWKMRITVLWYGIAGILVFTAAMYPIMATRGKSEFRMSDDVPLTLDGMDYMQYTTHHEAGISEAFDLIHDYNTIRWLQENVEGSPVIIEAISGRVLYQWGARIANYTGLPSIVGWDYHQKQQRSLDPLPSLVSQRVANVNAFYTTRDMSATINILRHYAIEYVIVSAYERVRYEETGGLDKLDWLVEQGIMTVVYHEGEATIYHVNQPILYAVWVASLP